MKRLPASFQSMIGSLNSKDFMNGKLVALIIVLALLGGILRVYKLEQVGLWVDEIHSMIGSNPSKSLFDVVQYAKSDQPPLFFICLHYWLKLFSFTDFFGRLFTSLLGVVGIVVVFFLGKEFKDKKTGVLLSIITAINYFHIDLSREIRSYPLVFVLTSLSYLMFLRSTKKGSYTDYLLYIVFTSLLLNTHYFGLVVFLTQSIIFIGVVFWYKKNAQFVFLSLVAGTITGLSLLHWLPVIQSDLAIQQFHVTPVPFYFPIAYLWVFFRDPITCLIVGCLGVFFFYMVASQYKIKNLKLEYFIVLLWLLLGFLIPLIYSVVKMPLLTAKYSFIQLPCVFLIVSISFSEIKSIKLQKLLLLVMMISALVNLFFVKPMYNKQPYDQWREVAEVVANSKSNKLVFSKYEWYLNYYLNQKNIKAYDFRFCQDGNCDFYKKLPGANGFWLQNQNRYPDEGLSQDQKDLIDRNYTKVETLEFTDCYLHYYQKSALP
jgi:uncharacterized membrane protein